MPVRTIGHRLALDRGDEHGRSRQDGPPSLLERQRHRGPGRSGVPASAERTRQHGRVDSAVARPDADARRRRRLP